MNTGSQLVLVLSLVGAAVAVHVVARHRAGRFLLVRVPDAGRHRAATRRVLAVNALVAAAAAVTILGAPDSTGRTQLVAWLAAMVVPPLWIVGELCLGLRGTLPAPVPSRFHVWLERPPSFLSYLSPSLQLLHAAALIAPPVALLVVWKTSLAPWLGFFLPLMIFLAALILFCAWMQAGERWVLPDEDRERYVALQQEKRRRTVRMLETAMLGWNLAAGLVWVSVAAGSAGPGYLGAGIAVVTGGPGVVAAMAMQLPRLIQIADELAALAGTEVLGTRRDGWRLHGLFYCSPSDPALFVPKRSGLGQTLNFGRPAAWLFLTGVLLVPPAIILLSLAGAGLR